MTDSDTPLSPRGSTGGDGAAVGRPTTRRGSVQLMHDINVQQFPYPHSSLPGTPVAAVSSSASATATSAPMSLLSALLSSSSNREDPTENDHGHNNSMDAGMPLTDLPERRAARDLLHVSNMRHTRSIVDPRGGVVADTVPVWSQGDEEEFVEDGGGMTREEWFSLKDAARVSGSGQADEEEEQQALLLSSNIGQTSGGSYGATQPPLLPEINHPSEVGSKRNNHAGGNFSIRASLKQSQNTVASGSKNGFISNIFQQSSAVAVIALLNMMISIPFGASYFPIGWSSDDGSDSGEGQDDEDGLSGTFPLPGKQALGLRMFLFATMIAQLVFAFKSKFINAVGLQMVENVPFLHALAKTVINRQGYGADSLSTLFFLFGISSVIVGAVFYSLGKLQLGKIVYFFPNHVLVGCIGGIGVFIVFTAIEVTTNTTFTLDLDGLESLVENFRLLWVVLAFETVLRLLTWLTQDKDGRPKFQLLSPVFYIMITPIFYLGLTLAGVSIEQARSLGYFFPTTNSGGDAESLFDPHLFDIFRVIDFSTISWMAVLESTGTMIALAAFSLIHVPINIPAFAISTDVETDMNAELIAHGYSNFLSGAFGGLQNYMSYSNSVLYAKSGGKGPISSMGIVLCTAGLFVFGPSICDYLPRCMAGTLLLHIGVDLVLEGVYDSIGQYDNLEYAGVWLITLVMTFFGMTAALLAGIVSALSTYAVQSVNYNNPIRQILTATTLRSSAWTRCGSARSILEDEKTGRARILIFQLQGHLFFGNVAQLTDTIKEVLKEKHQEKDDPFVVIVDFTLVVGMDSSAAHAIAKLKKIIHRFFHVEISVFVTGSDRGGFPCEFALSEALSGKTTGATVVDDDENDANGLYAPAEAFPIVKSSATPNTKSSFMASKVLKVRMDGRVCESLDDALKFAEDFLIARQDPQHHFSTSTASCPAGNVLLSNDAALRMSVNEEKDLARIYWKDLLEVPETGLDASPAFLSQSIDLLVSMMTREEVKQDDIIWEQGSESACMKILISGELLSIVDETGASEPVARGNVMGELGLVHGTKRLTTLVCASPRAVMYNLDVSSWNRIKRDHPRVASLIDRLVIRYLAHRVQHVSNRYFHTTLPV